MVARADILAGRAVILINIQDTIDKQLRTIRNKIRTFSNGLNEIGGDLFRGGIAGTVGSIFPIKEFVNFQDQMLFLQTKAQATEKQMRSLERVIRNLGMTTSFSSTEVAKGATMLAQAGFQPSAIEASLQAVLDLARGSRIELETSSTILSNILSAYQLDPGRASEVASKLIATARLGTLDVVDIGESMKELMTTARQLNLPLEDTLGMIAQISNMSLRATKAGTSLNAAWANLSAKSEQLAELGITITDSDLENPIQVFAKLSEALRRLPRQQQVQTLQSLFAIRGGRGFGAVLMQDLDELERKIRVIKTAGDEARLSAEKLDSQLGGVGRRAISAFQELMLAIGGTSEGPLTVFGENLAKVFNNMSRLATANPKFVQGLLLIGPASLAAGAGLLTLTMIGGKLAMLITPLMMLNAAIFKTAAAIVGVNKRSLYGLYYAIARPYVTAMTAVDKYNQAVNKAAEAQAAYMLGPSEKGLKKAQSAAKAAANMAKKLPFFMQENSVWQRQLSSAELLTKAYNKLGKATRAAYVPVMPRQGTNALLPRRLAEGNMPLTPLRLPLPILEPQFQLGRSAQLPILNNQVQNIFKQVTQGKQLTFGFEIQPNLPRRQLEVTNNFKSMADIIKEVTQAANELYKSPAFAEGMTDEQRRARAVRSALEVRGMPAQLSRQVRGGLDAALSKASFKSGPSLIQRIFDFQDVPEPPANIVQKMFAFEDVPKQMEKQFEIGRKKIIGRNASATVGFTNRFGTPNTMAARQAAADAQNEAIRLARQSQRIRPFAWIKPLINDIKLLLPSGKALAGVFSGIGKAFRAVGRGIASVNWLRVTITGTTKVLKTLRFIFTVLNNIRRFVFSLNGALLILEALIIFGDKIPGINQLLAGTGKALSSLFKDLGNTLANLNPSLQLVRRGIRDIFTGESERGISRLKVAFTDITNIIRTGWTSAWSNFMQNIEPAAQRLKIVFEGVVGTVKVLVASIGAGLGTVFSSGGLLIKGDGTLLETIKSAFSTENMKAFFGGVIAFVGEIGLRLNSILGAVAGALNALKQSFIAMLKSLTWIKGSGAQQALNELDSNYVARKSLQVAIDNIDRGIRDGSLKGRVKEQLAIREQFQAELKKLPPAFNAITYNVEAGAKAIKDAMKEASESIANSGQPATPQEYGPGNAAGIAAFQARMNLMADTFGASFFGQGAKGLGGALAGVLGSDTATKGLVDFLPSKEDAMKAFDPFGDISDAMNLALIETGIKSKRLDQLFSDFAANNEGGDTLQQDILADIAELRRTGNPEVADRLSERMKLLDSTGKIWEAGQKDLAESSLKSLKSWLSDPKLPDVSGLVAGFKEAFLGIKPDLSEQESQIASVASNVGKALVGDFASTRGNTLQVVPRLEKLQEKAIQVQEEIASNTGKLLDKPPMAFV